jgi:diguanylate cyclase (GGDEF)-like protein
VIGEERRHPALRHEAVTDPLTGLGNRSALRRQLDSTPGPVTVAIIALDDFKPINDTHEHHTGDAVLPVVADRVRGAVRADDVVTHYGGDEFAVVFAHQTSPDGSAQLARRIVTAIEAPIALNGTFTISVGEPGRDPPIFYRIFYRMVPHRVFRGGTSQHAVAAKAQVSKPVRPLVISAVTPTKQLITRRS